MQHGSSILPAALKPRCIPFLTLATLPLASAALQPSAVAQEAAPPVLAQEFEPIRFGDDEAHAWTRPMFPGASHDASIPTPESFLGQPVGSRIAAHDEMLRMLRAWADASERVVLLPYGRTYEGRELVRLIITSPANHARLDEVRRGVRALFDPRGLDDAEAERLVTSLPGVAWMGYGIHGDETSASEAAVPVAYHLAACTDASITELLDEVVVVLDPCLNPDGRERIRSMVVQNAGYRANLDHAAMHRGRWPYGRGNHYLFDMNRDWMAGEAPETRARWAALLDLPPQLFVDAHEMSGLDTFLFYPQAPPRNPYLPERLLHWQEVFAGDAAAAFDRYSWGYYTREWADAWAPIYSDAWGSLTGAIGMLYEQGRTIGAPLRRDSGEVVAYRESVHGQVVASLANLESFRAHRVDILRDYLAHRRAACAPAGVDSDGVAWEGQSFLVVPGPDVERHARFLRALVGQGIEVFEAEAAFEASDARGAFGARDERREFPAGTWIVPAAQPQGALVRAYLDFDPRVDDETLQRERENLERDQGSDMYDLTGWDLGRQYGLDCAWALAPDVARRPLAVLRAERGPVGDIDGAYAWIADGADGRSVRFAARALELGLRVHVSDRDFTARVRTASGAEEARDFARGSFLLRRHENRPVAGGSGEALDALVRRAAEAGGAPVWAAATGRTAGEGPDLGGGHFALLREPRVAIVSNAPVSSTEFGALWRYLDEELGLEVSLVDAQAFGRADLRRFNVLVLPPGATGALEGAASAIGDWVRAGGTLVAVGSSAHDLLGEPFELSSSVLRRDALEDLERHAFLVARERAALAVEVDPADVWDAPRPDGDAPAEPAEGAGEGDGSAGDRRAGDRRAGDRRAGDRRAGDDRDGDVADDVDPDAAAQDEWMRRFAPAGVVLAARSHPEMWITAGGGDDVAVPFSGSRVWLTTAPAAVRLAPAADLRLGGLLWPEARQRIADSAWLTVERRGRGQVVCFLDHPIFRGSWRGTARYFANAVVVGPGAGTDAPPLGR